MLRRLADPVLTNLAQGTLKARMPVEQAPGADRRSVTHLEALGRLLAGMAPWLELGADGTEEGRLRGRYADLARRAIARAVDPASPDFLNFTRDRQPLVDAAFLGQALLRAPKTLRDALDDTTKRQSDRRPRVLARHHARTTTTGCCSRRRSRPRCKQLGASWDRLRVDYAIRQHEQWYKGDGAYGDGADFHWDYYNSFVIHPMMLDVLDACADDNPAWKSLIPHVDQRARRYAAVQERLIAPDGSFPPSAARWPIASARFICSRRSRFADALPDGVSPAQVRSALTAIIRRSIEADGNVRSRRLAADWLLRSSAGRRRDATFRQEACISVRWDLLPLGLPATDEFWSAPPQPWTAVARVVRPERFRSITQSPGSLIHDP